MKISRLAQLQEEKGSIIDERNIETLNLLDDQFMQ